VEGTAQTQVLSGGAMLGSLQQVPHTAPVAPSAYFQSRGSGQYAVPADETDLLGLGTSQNESAISHHSMEGAAQTQALPGGTMLESSQHVLHTAPVASSSHLSSRDFGQYAPPAYETDLLGLGTPQNNASMNQPSVASYAKRQDDQWTKPNRLPPVPPSSRSAAASLGRASVPQQQQKLAKKAGYTFGDLSRSVVAKGKKKDGRGANDGYKFGDFTKGLFK
jgi:hypothetical protein